MEQKIEEQKIPNLMRMNLVTGIVLYCKVLASCRGPTYVTICKWYFKLNTLKTYLLTFLLTYLLIYLLADLLSYFFTGVLTYLLT